MKTLANKLGPRAAGVLLLLPAALWAAPPQDPCAAFTWDVQHERALFGGAAQSLTAATAPGGAPALLPERLYELRLASQSQVSFAAPPERQPKSAEAYAGLATLRLDKPGTYRISLDQPAWVDVVANGAPVRSADFQGRPGCHAPHKIVEFSLPAGVLTLQFSGGSTSVLRVSVSRSPGQHP
jgi:hypothetical protein